MSDDRTPPRSLDRTGPAARLAAGLVAAGPALALASVAAGGGDLEIILPPGFEAVEILSGLADPATMAFAPDGRLFIGERIQGRLRVVVPDGAGGWALRGEPFHVFDVPHDGTGVPVRHRSSGVRGFDFDADFSRNGRIHAFVMQHAPRHNRLMTITADPAQPDRSTGAETTLLDLPFNGDASSGSHNGGTVLVGPDGRVHVTTGDGWNGGDTVQSLETWTGKVLRLDPDGSIPADNAFAGEATGDFRAIHALGLRNPFSGTRHPETGELFVHDVRGGSKASLHRIEAGANWGHDGASDIGTPAGVWVDAGLDGASGRIVTGGAWYPACGPFGPEYSGDLFVGLWGSNGTDRGQIARIVPDPEGGPAAVVPFATEIRQADPRGALRPVALRVGPDGLLYLLVSGYEAESGRVHVIRPVASPPDPDLDGDGTVGLGDLLAVLGAWGDCPAGGACPADLDGDGMVGAADLLAVLAAWSVA